MIEMKNAYNGKMGDCWRDCENWEIVEYIM
jgi:hypothetical protein